MSMISLPGNMIARHLTQYSALLVCVLCVPTVLAQLVSTVGDDAIIPGWNLQTTANLSSDMTNLSMPGADVSSWYRLSSRGSILAGQLENGVYNDTELFFSENLETMLDASDYQVPWVFREEFEMDPADDQHYFLDTHGITSRADIYVNGEMVASNETQVGSYGGHRYEITQYLTTGTNCILITAYPTNYLRDFAMGFVDWNPYPSDNGSGVWREVNIHQSGPVSLSAPRIKTDFEYTWQQTVSVILNLDATNNANESVEVTINAAITSEDGQTYFLASSTTLSPGQERTVSLVTEIDNPQIWWPAQWGEQPLYTINATASINNTVSDVAEPRSFGIRKISSHLNTHNDTAFLINGHPFLVQGAGYSADIFYRFNTTKARRQLQLVLDMGLNTIRLEGKQEHPELYTLCDQMGIMIMAGWECCDKWEGWSYNDEADGVKWVDDDYTTANASMLHEAARMQTHPSFLAFLVGSDFWPDDRATQIYVSALDRYDWPNPIIASAAERGYPDLLGLSGIKMLGPYDWVPESYWWFNELGAAFGFGSELGAGVGTPELSSLTRFLSPTDLSDLWQSPNATLYHMSTADSSFSDRSIYNAALSAHYGAPTSLDDYLLKAQLADYTATRAQFEAYAARKTDERPSTGLIYWMLNGAWPNLHWQLFDYYLAAGGAYYGTKVATRAEHVVYNPLNHTVHYISNGLNTTGERSITADIIALNGTLISTSSNDDVSASGNTAQIVTALDAISQLQEVTFLKLVLSDPNKTSTSSSSEGANNTSSSSYGNVEEAVLSRNTYAIPAMGKDDTMNFTNSSWYSTPVTAYADFSSLFNMTNATLDVSVEQVQTQPASAAGGTGTGMGARVGMSELEVTLENTAGGTPAFFVRLVLLDGEGGEVLPQYWGDNYVTVFGGERVKVGVRWEDGIEVGAMRVGGVNVGVQSVNVGGGVGNGTLGV